MDRWATSCPELISLSVKYEIWPRYLQSYSQICHFGECWWGFLLPVLHRWWKIYLTCCHGCRKRNDKGNFKTPKSTNKKRPIFPLLQSSCIKRQKVANMEKVCKVEKDWTALHFSLAFLIFLFTPCTLQGIPLLPTPLYIKERTICWRSHALWFYK